MTKKGLNISSIKAENSSIILNCIRKRAISRAELVKLTGLSKSAVTTIVKQLIDEGQLVEIGTESTSYGRHPILLDIVKNYRYAMGISLHRTKISVCIVNLKLECENSISCKIEEFSTPEQALLWAYRTGIRLLEKHNIDKKLCVGVGISAPGPLDYKNGVILTPPNFQMFHNFDVYKCLSAVCDMPVFLNNTPVLMAMYEHIKRPDKTDNYAFVIVENGVGSAIIQNGKVYRGSAGFSGEIGHTTIDVNGAVCSCGNTGCLEGYITRKAIKTLYGINSYEELIDRAYDGDTQALGVVDTVARNFTGGIINAVNMLDLEAIIISGELNYRNELLFSKLQQGVDNRAIISRTHRVKILPSIITTQSGISFAAATVIEKYFSNRL